MKNRLTVLALFCFMLAGAILFRAVQIQMIGDPRVKKLAGRQLKSSILVTPRRGLIVDRNGFPLAVNRESISLAASPTKIKEKQKLARRLSKDLKISYSKLLKRFRSKRGFVWIKRHVPDRVADKYRTETGVWLISENQRVYPQGETASHVLGSVNIDSEGIEGVELWMNEKLAGQGRKLGAIKDALGRSAFIDAVSAQKVKDGESVTLTLDASLQFEVESHLKAALEKTKSRSGTVIVMNAVTGEILALANAPSFNPNHRKGSQASRRNRALTDGYEPGSTMKPILLGAALDAGMSESGKIHGGKGRTKIQGRWITEAEAHEQFEWITLEDMVRLSSNVVAAKLALKLGPEKLLTKLQELGFSQKTRSGFPGEISSRLPRADKVRPIRLANIGFGQGLFTTSIQMARVYAAFLNGGWLVQPSLIRLEDQNENAIPPQRVFSAEVAEKVTQALLMAASPEGTGNRAAVPGFLVAGKTGTAQVIDPRTRRYSKKDYIASFIGFAAEVEPRLVILTTLDRPMGRSYYAAETAAPLFREVLKAVANRFGFPVKPVKTEIVRYKDEVQVSSAAPQPPSANARKLELKRRLTWHAQGQWKMPDLIGLSAKEAIQSLKGYDFKLSLSGFGVVQEQKPQPGSLIRDGETLSLKLEVP